MTQRMVTRKRMAEEATTNHGHDLLPKIKTVKDVLPPPPANTPVQRSPPQQVDVEKEEVSPQPSTSSEETAMANELNAVSSTDSVFVEEEASIVTVSTSVPEEHVDSDAGESEVTSTGIEKEDGKVAIHDTEPEKSEEREQGEEEEGEVGGREGDRSVNIPEVEENVKVMKVEEEDSDVNVEEDSEGGMVIDLSLNSEESENANDQKQETDIEECDETDPNIINITPTDPSSNTDITNNITPPPSGGEIYRRSYNNRSSGEREIYKGPYNSRSTGEYILMVKSATDQAPIKVPKRLFAESRNYAGTELQQRLSISLSRDSMINICQLVKDGHPPSAPIITIRDHVRMSIKPRFFDKGAWLTPFQWRRLWDLRQYPTLSIESCSEDESSSMMSNSFQLEGPIFLQVCSTLKKYPIQIRRLCHCKKNPAVVLNTLEGHRLTRDEWRCLLRYGGMINAMLDMMSMEKGVHH